MNGGGKLKQNEGIAFDGHEERGRRVAVLQDTLSMCIRLECFLLPTCACLCCSHLAGCRESSSTDPGLLPPPAAFRVLPAPQPPVPLTHSGRGGGGGGTDYSRGHGCCCLVAGALLAQRTQHSGLQLRQQPPQVRVRLTVVGGCL